MKAEEIVAKTTRRNIYNTDQGVYQPAASVNDQGELMVTLKPSTPPGTLWPRFITVRFTRYETRLIRKALGAHEGEV